MGDKVRKAGEWVARDVKRQVGFHTTSFWWRIKYGILNFLVAWIPNQFVRSMASSALHDMADAAAQSVKRKKGDAESSSKSGD